MLTFYDLILMQGIWCFFWAVCWLVACFSLMKALGAPDVMKGRFNLIGKTVSVGRTYVCLAHQGAGSPMIDRCSTFEKGGQKRHGDGRLIRLPFKGGAPTVGLVIGLWRARGPAV